jgi:hypothetical protein
VRRAFAIGASARNLVIEVIMTVHLSSINSLAIDAFPVAAPSKRNAILLS